MAVDLGYFKILTLLGTLKIQNPTSGGVLCIFGSRTFVPLSWMCKKQTAVSHSSTESEIISLDAGLRMDGSLALDLWDVVIEVLHETQGNATLVASNSRETAAKPKKHTQTRTNDDQKR